MQYWNLIILDSDDTVLDWRKKTSGIQDVLYNQVIPNEGGSAEDYVILEILPDAGQVDELVLHEKRPTINAARDTITGFTWIKSLDQAKADKIATIKQLADRKLSENGGNELADREIIRYLAQKERGISTTMSTEDYNALVDDREDVLSDRDDLISDVNACETVDCVEAISLSVLE